MGLLDRTISECSDDIDIRPLEFGDLKRRLSESFDNGSHDVDIGQNGNTNLFFSVVMGLKRKKGLAMYHQEPSLVKMAWKNAAKKALSIEDPWEKFHLNEYKTEKALRHRFHALKKFWVIDEVLIKMETEPFNHGAMRECFRTKKLSNFAKRDDWSRAHNYVSKRYMNGEVDRLTYFDDVRLQMDAKLWGEEFNRHNPPKKVDIFQMAILELIEREGKPLFHVEHFIEGNYVKYNSNSGFVKSEAIRMTPQAFSHFSFERSGHELIVVDIQGVGDLYTDPQIHTASGSEYGDGNLGTRGMALFFHTHVCNPICLSLGLTQFDLYTSEINDSICQDTVQKSAMTVIRGTEERVMLPSEGSRDDIHICHRLRSISSGYASNDERERINSIGSIGSVDSFDDFSVPHHQFLDDLHQDSDIDVAAHKVRRQPRIRYDSTTDFGESTETKEIAWKQFNELAVKNARPSHVLDETEHRRLLDSLERDSETIAEASVLGQIHLDLAKYHELNRFVEENQSYDHDAGLFHLKYAAKCGNLEAVLSMAQIHLGLTNDVLPDIELDESLRDTTQGFEYLLKGAKYGDRASMIRVAKAYDNGCNLPSQKSIDWNEAVNWYEKAIRTEDPDCSGGFDGAMNDPVYQLIARQAQLYLDGEYGLKKDPNIAGELFTEAADLATEAMKGKLASKYYMKAEEAWAQEDEE